MWHVSIPISDPSFGVYQLENSKYDISFSQNQSKIQFVIYAYAFNKTCKNFENGVNVKK